MRSFVQNYVMGGISLILIAASCTCLGWTEFSSGEEIIPVTILVLLYGAIIVLIIQIVVLLLRQEESGRLILLSTNGGKLQFIDRIQPLALIEYCRKEFKMEYRMESWPALRSQLLADSAKDHLRHVRLGDQMFLNGKLSASEQHAAYLQYRTSDGEKQSILMRLEEMPTETDAAILLVKRNLSEIQIFYSTVELIAWLHNIPPEMEKHSRPKIHRFLKNSDPGEV